MEGKHDGHNDHNRLRVGQRIKILDPSDHFDCVALDVTEINPDGMVKGLGIHPSKTMRPPISLGSECWLTLPGRPIYAHIDGEKDGFGKNRQGQDEKEGGRGKRSKSGGKAGEKGESKGEGQGGEGGGQSNIDEERIREIAREEASELDSNLIDAVKDAVEEKLNERAAQDVVIKIDDLPPIELEGVMHDSLPRIIKLVRAKVAKGNVLLVGPAGCGKTTLARGLTEALGFNPETQFAAISCSPGMSESKLLGRVIPRLTGEDATLYESTPLVEVYANGGVILLDELDNADPSILVSLNTLLDNGMVNLPSGEIALRHPNTVIIASANTFGHGADRIYVGRNQLDGSTLDRFVCSTLNLDYDRKLETTLIPEKHIRERIWSIRQKARDAKLRRIISTRMLINVRLLMLSVGDTLNEAIHAATVDWSEQDKRTCGIAA